MHTPIPVTRGIWRPPHVAETLPGRVAAVLRALPPGTVVAGVTAARLYGLWLPDQEAPGERIEVIVHPSQAPQRLRSYNRRAEVRARRQLLLPDEVTTLGGLEIVTEARCWLDLADRLSPADLVAVGDSALRGSATADEMEILVKRAYHRRGVILARRLLPLLDGRSRSRPESHLRFALVDAGLPKPAVNEPIYDSLGEWLGEPDLSYEDVRLAMEYNGAAHANLERMRRDITRELDIEIRGNWRTVVFGPTEVFRRPDEVVLHVRRLRNSASSW